ncbi:hypothetical protein J1614_003862 [Plenodomus biglobosus]|nr:hypothetical protein J1614_003862 [Plenodomus biglobosus]
MNKEGFLPAFKDTFFNVFTEKNCQKVFEASGLVLHWLNSNTKNLFMFTGQYSETVSLRNSHINKID